MPRIQHKRGTSTNLTAANPTPLAGELVWDSTENAIKIGDGSAAWSSLAYVTATPRSHKSSHATGGSDALTPSDIGAAPAASPVFSGNVGIATDPSPFSSSFNNLVVGNGSSVEGMTIYSSTQGTLAFGDTATTGADGYRGYLAYIHSGDYMVIGTGGTERFRAYASGVIVSGVITVAAGTAAAPAIVASGDANTGLLWPAADTVAISTAGVERVRVDSVGRVRIYQTASDGTGVGRCEFMSHGGTTVSGGFILYGASYASGIYMGLGVSSLHLYNSGGHCSLSTTTAHDVVLGSNSLSRFRVKSTGAVRFVPLSADPASGEAGDVYYNSSTNKLRVYNGTSWVDLH